MAGKRHDNGAVDAPDRKIKKKSSRLDTVVKELAELKSSNVLLSKELEKAHETILSLQATLHTPRPDTIEVGSVEFESDIGPSSTHRQANETTVDLSRFMSSVNQISVSTINVPECKSALDGEEIGRHDFESWKDLLKDSMKLAGIDDEATQFILFKIKAGPKLLEVYKNTKSTEGSPDHKTHPFSNAISRLQSYYGSASDIMLQRRKLSLMVQKPEESDLSFVMRVGALARHCDFGNDKELEEIVSTIAEHAKNREVRTMALKMLSRKGSFTELVDKVREIQAISMNEEYYHLKHSHSGQAIIAPVKAGYASGISRQGSFRNPAARGYGNQQFRRREETGPRHNMNWRGQNDLQGNTRERCFRCNSIYHKPNACFATDKICLRCGRKGHIQRACRLFAPRTDIKRPAIGDVEKQDMGGKMIAAITDNEDTKTEEQYTEKNILAHLPIQCDIASFYEMENSTNNGIIVAKVAGLPCEFLIDSGAQVNTLTKQMFNKLSANETYRSGLFNFSASTDRPLRAYATAEEIQVVSTFEAFLYISDDRPTLIEKFYVVNEVRSLLSRPTATRYSVLLLGLQVPISPSIRTQSNRISSCSGYEVGAIDAGYSDEIFPKFNIPPVEISYDRTIPPCRNIFTNIPLAVKPLVEQRLKQLISAGIIERITNVMDTSFCSSMLAIPKGKDDIRLVIDLRGPNRHILRTPFAMPCLEKILAELDGATWFSTIDLANAFFHIELHENSRHLTNFFTEFGMFRCVRLPFGLCNAPDIFQEVLQRKILGDCKGVKNYLDDILVFGKTKQEHDENLAAVQARLSEHNVKVNTSKCVFGSKVVKFLGFVLTASGWQIEDDKLSAIKSFRRPACLSEVKSFLGLVTFVDRFLVDRATKTERLRALANADFFYWTVKEEEEFVTLQNEALHRIKTLGFFNTTDRTELYVDASAIGLGAVLVQFSNDGIPRIIACASKALTITEQKYPQTHREALAVVWGVERFSYYLTSRSFIIRTDAEANEFIFNGRHRIGKRAVSRAEGWALRLQPYDFSINRVPGKENVADALSRLIQLSQDAEPFEEENDGNFLFALDSGYMEITLGEIETDAEVDKELRQLRKALKYDKWPRELRKFEAHKNNLYYLGSLTFKDDKIILPQSLRTKALASAHSGHVGEVAMKRVMREFFWWPGMAAETEQFVKNCTTCCQLSRRNPPVPLSSRDLPEGPWEILQVDFLSLPNFGSGEFLVVVDVYSRYLSVIEMQRTNAEKTNAALCEVFKLWGFPRIMQSDNGPPFQSSEFCTFWESKGVKVRKAIPLSPQSNGSVERQNQGLIKAVAASRIDGINWRRALQEYVHKHNTLVPHSRLNVTPFELVVGWKYRGTFPSLWSDSNRKVLDRTNLREKDAETKLNSKIHADTVRGAKDSDIQVGDTVLLNQQRKNKTDPTFSSERFMVVEKHGAKVVIVSRNGIQYARNVQDLKRAPNLDEGVEETGIVDQGDAYSNIPDSTEGMLDISKEGIELERSAQSSDSGRVAVSNLRRREGIRRPTRFNKDYIYRIYE